MAYVDWPAGVPFRPERDNWNGVPGREALATDMQGGDVRQRWQPGDDLATLQWGHGLTAAQMASWGAFLATIAGGAARFLMPVSLNGQAYELRVVQIKGGKGGLRYASLGAETLVSFSHYVFPAALTPAVPVITGTGDQVVGTGTSGQAIEIDFGGAATRSVVAAGGAFVVDTPFLADGAYWVRARYAGGQWSIPVLMAMPTPLKSTLRAQLLGSASGVALDFAGTMGGLILAPAAPSSQYLGPVIGATMFTRASTATRINAQGLLETVAANVPRMDYDPITKALKGLRMEGARTNQITNNTMVGGVSGTPGTAPTGWPAWAFSGDVQFTRTFGVEDGIPYLDIRLWGTPSVTTGYRLAPQATSSVAVAAGESYTSSVFAGFKDLTAPPANCQWRLLWGSGGDAEVNGPDIPLTVIANGDLKNKRYSHTRTAVLAAPGTGVILRIGVTGGVYIDFTFRLALPQIEAGAHASSPILTSGTAVTRAADSCSVNMASIASLTEGTIALDCATEFAASATGVLSLQKTGLGSNSVYIYVNPSFSIGFGSYREGVVQSGSAFSPVSAAGVKERVAVSAKNAAMRAARNGGAAIGAGSGFLFPTLDGAVLAIGGGAFFGWISSIKYFPTALSDAQLQALTA